MGIAQFHFTASVFGGTADSCHAYPNSFPDEEIRRLRDNGCFVGEISKKTGVPVSVVRRIVGKLDPVAKQARAAQQAETAHRINASPGSWAEKVRMWQEATGQSEATFWRLLKKIRSK